MIRMENIATMLALIGSVDAAVASEALQVADQAAEHKTGQAYVDFQKDDIEFMGDTKLANIQGTGGKINVRDVICMLHFPGHSFRSGKIRNCIKHFNLNPTL